MLETNPISESTDTMWNSTSKHEEKDRVEKIKQASDILYTEVTSQGADLNLGKTS